MLDTCHEQLYLAWQRFRKGKKPSLDIDRFAYDLESNLQLLSEQLQAQTYRHGVYRKISVIEKKRRDLAVATVPDRVVHRLLYDYLVNLYDSTFDPDVWSCRKRKGLHKCLARTQKLLHKHQASYVWRADITKFFDNVDYGILLGILERKLAVDNGAMWLCREIVSSYNMNRTDQNRTEQNRTGIPIGNLTSQIFSNIYLNEFDRFVRHNLKPQAYLRYGDDFVLLAPTRQWAFDTQVLATAYLKDRLRLDINPNSNVMVSARTGLKFLGHDVTAQEALVDVHTSKHVLARATPQNIASYKSLYLRDEYKKQLDWLFFEN